MANSNTTYLNLIKPEVGADTDQWGGHINEDLDALDAILGGVTAVSLNTVGKNLNVTAGNTSFKDGTDATKIAKFSAASISAGTTRTFTLPNVTDTLVTLTATQTLTNKTLTSPVINNGGVLTLPTTAATLVGRATTDTLTNKTIDTAGTNTIKINGNTLAATAGTATITLPNSTATLVGRATTDTLTNKTLISPVINNGGVLTLPSSTDTLVGRATTDTLTNKTLISPVINNGGVLTLPSSTDTLVGRATTDTLTNKRINSRVTSTASSATPTPDVSTTDQYNLTALAAAAAFGIPAGSPLDGQKLIIRIKDNGTARALTWNGIYRAVGISLPSTTVISKTTYVGLIYNDADDKWDAVATATQA